MNLNCHKCNAAKPTSPEKGHILVKRGNSSMNDIFTEVIFYIHQKDFCKFRVSLLLFEIFIEIYSSRFLLMLIYSTSVSPYYNYSFLITITSQFSIYLPRSVGLGSGFFRCLNFRKQPSLSALKKCFLRHFLETFQ